MKSKRALPLLAVLLQLGAALAFAAGGRSVDMVVSVDWEGEDISRYDTSAMRSFREANPDIRLTHFLNAAYFVKPGADAAALSAAIKSVLRDGDQIGLHIHGWKSLFEAAGVPYRSAPGFWSEAGPGDCSVGPGVDCGHDVQISAYGVAELRRVMRFSLDTLAANGFKDIKVFRAGGWVAAPNVLEAAAREGLTGDSSSVTVPLLRREIGSLPLYSALENLWPGTNPLTGPYRIGTPGGTITEYPDNMALADYVTGEEVFSMYRDAASKSDSERIYVHYGFHSETARRFLERVETAVSKIRRDAASRGYEFNPLTLAGLSPAG